MAFLRFTSIVILLVLVGAAATCQVLSSQPEQDACGAIPVCGGIIHCPFYKGWGTIKEIGPATFPVCFPNEQNSVWFHLKTNSPGIIAFTITPDNFTNNFDFAVFHSPCNTVSSSYPAKCNGSTTDTNGSVGGVTGLIVGAGPQWLGPGLTLSNPFSEAFFSYSGVDYYIVVNNSYPSFPFYYNPNIDFGGFTIDFTNSTATFADTSQVHFLAVANTCNKSQQITVELNGPLKCSSIASNGSDFYLTPAVAAVSGAYSVECIQNGISNSYTRRVTVQFDQALSPGNYVLHSQTGNDGNTLLSLCDSQQPINDAIMFTVDPYQPPTFTSIDSPACQYLIANLSQPVLCDSISADGSDFKVVGPSSVAITAAFGSDCDSNGLTTAVIVELSEPITTDGTYFLKAKQGTDHNTLIDTCTGHQLEGNQVTFSIKANNGALVALSDTVLCKADNIALSAATAAWMDFTECGINTRKMTTASITREVTGLPGTTTYLPGTRAIFAAFNAIKKQMIYRASELQALGLRSGSITKIGWTLDPNEYGHGIWPLPSWWPPPRAVFDNFTIKLSCTAETSLSSGQMISGAKTVYSTTNFCPTGHFYDFVLDSSYNWDGISNLVVEICGGVSQLKFYTGIDSQYVNSGFEKCSKTAFPSSISQYTWFSQQDGCSANSFQYLETSDMRPDTRFTVSSPPLTHGVAYSWTPAESILGDSTLANITVFPSATTTYTVTAVDRYGCYLKDTVRVGVSELSSSVSPLDTTICRGDTVQFLAEAGTLPASYSWISSSSNSLTCLSCKNPVATPNDTTTYYVTISDMYGCSDTFHSLVNVNPLPLVTVTPADTTIRYGSAIQLNASGASLYSWSPLSSLSSYFVSNPRATPLEPTDYIVVGFADNGCRSSDTAHIHIDFRDEIFIPSAFSPNGDGLNDIFHIANLSFQKILEFRVFNRWGQEVYSTNNNAGWDGTVKGVQQDIGVYHYLIRIGYPDGAINTYKGDVTLIR